MAKHLGVSYVYEEEREALEPQGELTIEELTFVLPQELLEQLRQAAIRLNRSMVQELESVPIMFVKRKDTLISKPLRAFLELLALRT